MSARYTANRASSELVHKSPRLTQHSSTKQEELALALPTTYAMTNHGDCRLHSRRGDRCCRPQRPTSTRCVAPCTDNQPLASLNRAPLYFSIKSARYNHTCGPAFAKKCSSRDELAAHRGTAMVGQNRQPPTAMKRPPRNTHQDLS